MNKFLNFNKVLCLSPHPDDIEYAMAGSIIKFKDTHFDILCLSNGGDYDETTILNRKQEIYNFWNTIKFSNVSLLHTNTKLLNEKKEDEWIHYIENKLINIQDYDCIFCTTNEDSHFEHRFTFNIANALIRMNAISLIEYFTPSTLVNWSANLFINITDVYDIKLEMLKQFTSQQHKFFFKKDALDSFHSYYQASKRKLKITERFNINSTYIL